MAVYLGVDLPIRTQTVCWCDTADGVIHQRTHSLGLLSALAQQIAAVEQDLERHAATDARVARLRTHPGVGLLTALAVVHTLEPVTRFDRAPMYFSKAAPRSSARK